MPRYVSRSSLLDWEAARCIRYLNIGRVGLLRDHLSRRNVSSVKGQAGPKTKVVFWIFRKVRKVACRLWLHLVPIFRTKKFRADAIPKGVAFRVFPPEFQAGVEHGVRNEAYPPANMLRVRRFFKVG